MKKMLHPNFWFGTSKRRKRKQSKLPNQRRLRSETLEKRQLLAGDLVQVDVNRHHNSIAPTDANMDGYIRPSDILVLVNSLAEGVDLQGEQVDTSSTRLDVNDDGKMSPSDLLLVINDLHENGARKVGEVIEFHLNAFDLDGNELQPDASGNIPVDVNEVFELEVGYGDLRTNFTDTGLLTYYVDIITEQADILQPFLTEFQRLEFNASDLSNMTSGSFEFSVEGNATTHTTATFTGLSDFAVALQGELETALVAFGYTADQFEVDTSFGANIPVTAEIRFTDLALDRQDLPNISVTANANIPIGVVIDNVAPENADGTVNNEILEFAIDKRSRTFNNNDELYNFLNNNGSFDAATGFKQVGGVVQAGPIGGIPVLTGVQPLPNPFDAFSYLVRLDEPTTGLTVRLSPVPASENDEAVLAFDINDPITDDLILLDGDHSLTFVTNSTNQAAPVVSDVISQTFSENDAVATIDLLQFATDANGDPLTVTVTSTSGNTSGVSVSGNSLTVTPSQYANLNTGQSETVVFEYSVSDGVNAPVTTTSGGATISVSVTINGVDPANTPPTVSGAVSQTFVDTDSPAFVNLLFNASDVDGDSLSVQNVALSASNTGDARGITIDANNNQLSVTPQTYGALLNGESEVVTYSYVITDGRGGSVNQTATVTINGSGVVSNNVPVLQTSPLTTSFTEDDASTTFDLLTGASDADAGDTLSVSNISPASATGITVNGNNLSIDPSAYNSLPVGGSDTASFTYNVTDGTDSVAQSATITITGVNDAPVTGNALSLTRAEGTASTTLDLLTGSSDPDTGDTLSISGLTTSGNTAGVSVAGTTATIDPTQYTVAAGQTEVITLSYQVIDGNGGSVAQTATITITDDGAVANQAPTVSGPVTQTFIETDATGTVNLLLNASDADANDVLNVNNVILVSGDNSGITVSGNTLTVNPSAYSALDLGQSAVVQYSYSVTDGTDSVSQTATVTIEGRGTTNTNNAPTVSGPVSATFSEDDANGTVSLLTNASDLDSDTLTISGLAITGNQAGITVSGSTVTVNPNAYGANLNAGDTEIIGFSYTINDGNGGSVSQTASITINGANDGPGVGSVSGNLYIDHIENFADVVRGAAPIRNGVKDDDESGLAGITVTLTSASGARQTATTNLDGAYSFTNLQAGTYTVSYAVPEGVMFTGSTSGAVTVEASGSAEVGPNLGAIGLQGSLASLDILVSSYLLANQQMSAVSDGGAQGGSVSLDASGAQSLFVAGLGMDGIKFAELALNARQDAALLTVIEDNGTIKSARLSSDQFVVSRDGNAVQFFGGMEDFTFANTAENLLSQEFATYRDAIDAALANGI